MRTDDSKSEDPSEKREERLKVKQEKRRDAESQART